MKSFAIIKEAEDKETALSIPHIQSIEKDGDGCIVHYISPYAQERMEIRFNVPVAAVVDAIHETVIKLEKQSEGDVNTCPSCGKPIKICKGKTGYYFIGCSAYPKCNWGTPIENWMKAEGDPEKWSKQRRFPRTPS